MPTGSPVHRTERAARTSPPLGRSMFPEVSQELRSSLNVILGYAEMLGDTGFDDRARQDIVRCIKREGSALVDRVEGMFGGLRWTSSSTVDRKLRIPQWMRKVE